MSSALKQTALHALHVSKKGRMVEFAGYSMPIQYPLGILKEHLHTRTAAGLFDVSHMGQVEIRGKDRVAFMEHITPSDLVGLPTGKATLSMILNEQGGVKDDCIVSKYDDHLFTVLNAGCKEADLKHMREKLAEFKGDVQIVELPKALVALQGPLAAKVLGKYVDNLSDMEFMHGVQGLKIKGIPVQVTRCGYTGEDGFEIAVEDKDAASVAELFLDDKDVQLIGLGARDSLRLEAGMNLYGHELSETINPIAARIMWCIPKRRLDEGGFIGHARVVELKAKQKELVKQLRVGILSTGPVARAGTKVFVDGKEVGEITSGCPSPTLGKNVAMGYMDRALANKGQKVELQVRDKKLPAEVVALPFVQPHYYKK